MGSISEPEAEVKLLTDRCSTYAQRVQIALLEKGISFEPVYLTLPKKPTLLLEANPVYRQVPVLIHNGRTLSQSLVILEYLEDAFPEKGKLMPKDPYEKGRVRFWADFLHRGYSSFFDTYMKLEPGSPLKEAAMEGGVKWIRMVDAAMSSYSAEGPFFTGSELGLLDVVLAPFATSLQVSEKLDGFVIPDLPRFQKWVVAIRARPSVKASIPPADEHVNFMTRIFHSNRDYQLHFQELYAPQKFPHPRSKIQGTVLLTSQIVVYES